MYFHIHLVTELDHESLFLSFEMYSFEYFLKQDIQAHLIPYLS